MFIGSGNFLFILEIIKTASESVSAYAGTFAESFCKCLIFGQAFRFTDIMTKLYLDMRGKSKDGKGPVLITISHNRTTTTISTGVRISPKCWVKGKIVNTPDSDALNALIQGKKADIDKRIAVLSLSTEFESMTASEIKRSITSPKAEKGGKKSRTVVSLFHEYMESGNLSEGSKALYNATLKKIVSFGGENIMIDDTDYKWMRRFDTFLSKSQGTNGKAIYLRHFRAVCNYAKHIGATKNYPFDNFKIKHEETRKRSVPVELFREFYNYPTSEKNSYYRDYFFLSFFLIGINIKDLLLAKKSQIVDGRFEYSRSKTRKKYSIKIEPEAAALLKKYEGSGDYLLEAMDHCKYYRSFAKEINEGIQSIGETVTKEVPDSCNLFSEQKTITETESVIEGITTYYARHTWATLAHTIGVPIDVISMALGHSFSNRTTLIYIKPDQSKVDRANRQVIDYLLNG